MLAIYRKYRPKKLTDVLGQETIAEILKNAARFDKLAHAYLFYGPRGSGKTTTARIIAKLANCEKRQGDSDFKKQGEPCNECSACSEIDSGRALDVVEIDAASNRGIDEIRDLKEGIKFSPISYKCKVFIIDEAHQLTKEAFNALLKTLEEPPAHAIFILATTEYEKMPATIVSRTQRFHFKKLPLLIIVEKLKNIAKAEKIRISDEALELIAAAGEGSLRDAESLLDQLASLTQTDADSAPQIFRENLGGKAQTDAERNPRKSALSQRASALEVEDVEKILGKVGFSRTAEMAELLLKNDAQNALNYLAKINEGGYNLIQFNKDLIHYFRRVLALKFSPALEENFSRELTDQDLKKIKEHSRLIDEKKTIELVKSLIRAYSEMRYSPFAIVPLEVAIIENLRNADLLSKRV